MTKKAVGGALEDSTRRPPKLMLVSPRFTFLCASSSFARPSAWLRRTRERKAQKDWHCHAGAMMRVLVQEQCATNRVRSTPPSPAGHPRSPVQASAYHPGTPRADGGVAEQGRCEHARSSESCGVSVRNGRQFHNSRIAFSWRCQHWRRDIAARTQIILLLRCFRSQPLIPNRPRQLSWEGDRL